MHADTADPGFVATTVEAPVEIPWITVCPDRSSEHKIIRYYATRGKPDRFPPLPAASFSVSCCTRLNSSAARHKRGLRRVRALRQPRLSRSCTDLVELLLSQPEPHATHPPRRLPGPPPRPHTRRQRPRPVR